MMIMPFCEGGKIIYVEKGATTAPAYIYDQIYIEKARGDYTDYNSPWHHKYNQKESSQRGCIKAQTSRVKLLYKSLVVILGSLASI